MILCISDHAFKLTQQIMTKSPICLLQLVGSISTTQLREKLHSSICGIMCWVLKTWERSTVTLKEILNLLTMDNMAVGGSAALSFQDVPCDRGEYSEKSANFLQDNLMIELDFPHRQVVWLFFHTAQAWGYTKQRYNGGPTPNWEYIIQYLILSDLICINSLAHSKSLVWLS